MKASKTNPNVSGPQALFFLVALIGGSIFLAGALQPSDDEKARARANSAEEARLCSAAYIAEAIAVPVEAVDVRTGCGTVWIDVEKMGEVWDADMLLDMYARSLPRDFDVITTWRVVMHTSGPQGQEMIRTHSRASYASFEGVVKDLGQ